MTGRLGGVRTAFGFLTRLPVGAPDASEPALTRAGAYFPLVGLVVGAVGWAAWWIGTGALGPTAGAVLGVLATVAVTGALHEDGLADTADGLWGGASPARRLEIMRDSRIGTYGVLALGGELLLRVAILVPLDTAGALRVLIAGHVLGRIAPLVLAAWLPPARSDGLGVRLAAPPRRGAMVAAGTGLAAAVLAGGRWAPLVVAAGAIPVFLLGRLAHRRIGGVTGDVLGAAVVLTNLAVAASVAALIEGDAL